MTMIIEEIKIEVGFIDIISTTNHAFYTIIVLPKFYFIV